ncbi:MAG: hypothetical protein H8E79_02580 [Desulfobulbaceae bacterium]|uniref:Thioredoxin-like fold domain-containing protein n=1 Tax=Candidatus Desulfatifera sulfidica TaxID=2841691 RepID=A0A8J6N7A9_9BACT|nr:hypothetical protein [Candidatus Desulfatifera sulfidica]
MAKKALYELAEEHPELNITEQEITAAPVAAWREGIRMIPALKCNGHILSGILLNKQAILNFLLKTGLKA